MKKSDLIKLIESLPDDAEITILDQDDGLGYYSYNPQFNIVETDALKDSYGTTWATYSNYTGGVKGSEKVTVWTIE
jgi:hypothetical protein